MDIHNGPTLYRTSDGRIVADGDPEAAFLVASEGVAIPAEYAADITAYTDAQAAKRRPSDATTKRSAGPTENK